MKDKIQELQNQIEQRYEILTQRERELGSKLGNELFEEQYEGAVLDNKLVEMQNLKKSRSYVYKELQDILEDETFYQFLIEIDVGFQVLAWTYQPDKEEQFREKTKKLLDDLRRIEEENIKIGNPLEISYKDQFLVEKWSPITKKLGGQEKPEERLIIGKMSQLLSKKISQEEQAHLISDVFKYFYSIKKSAETIWRRYINK